MKHLLKLLFVTIILTGLTNCVKEDDDNDIEYELITVENESNDTIIAFLAFNYPDTYIPQNVIYGTIIHKYSANRGLKPHRAYTLTVYNKTRDEVFAQNDIAQVFIIKKKHFLLLRDKGGKYMSDNNLVLKRYEFTREELADLDWIVTYQ